MQEERNSYNPETDDEDETGKGSEKTDEEESDVGNKDEDEWMPPSKIGRNHPSNKGKKKKLADWKQFMCKKCGNNHSCKSALDRHLRKVHGKRFVCKKCGNSLSSEYDLKQHLRKVFHGNKSRQPKCEPCKKYFPTKLCLRRHIERVHKDIEIYPCQYCEKSFKHQNQLGEHVWVHTGRTSYPRSNCGQLYPSYGHRLYHNVSENIKCWECGEHFESKKDFIAHDKIHRGRLVSYQCPKCDATFERRTDLEDHKWNHEDEEEPVFVSSYEDLKDSGIFRKHVINFSEQWEFGCSTCGSRFENKVYLIKHIMNLHPNRDYESSSKQKVKVDSLRKELRVTLVKLNLEKWKIEDDGYFEGMNVMDSAGID